MAKITLTDVISGQLSSTVMNANHDTLETFSDTCLTRDGTSPNDMAADLDMGDNKIINLAEGVDSTDAVTMDQFNQLADRVTALENP